MANTSYQTCKHTEEEKKIANCCLIQSQSSKLTEERLQDLKTRITNVEKLTEEYEKEGLVIPNAQKFIHDCETIKKKIDKHSGEEKLSHLKVHVAQLEGLTAEVYKDDLASRSFEEFVETCKEFKNKLDERKNADNKSVCDGCVIDKQKSLISYSIDKYLESCGNSKCYIKNDKVENTIEAKPVITQVIESAPDVLKCLNSNINVMIDLINKSKFQKNLTPSAEEFLQVCEKFKFQLNSYIADDEKISVCLVCGNVDEKEEARESNINIRVERDVCGHRKKHKPICGSEEHVPHSSHKHHKSHGVNKHHTLMCVDCADPSYVGTQIRKVRKIIRTRNADGVVMDEKETITIDTKDMIQMK